MLTGFWQPAIVGTNEVFYVSLTSETGKVIESKSVSSALPTDLQSAGVVRASLSELGFSSIYIRSETKLTAKLSLTLALSTGDQIHFFLD